LLWEGLGVGLVWCDLFGLLLYDWGELFCVVVLFVFLFEYVFYFVVDDVLVV